MRTLCLPSVLFIACCNAVLAADDAVPASPAADLLAPQNVLQGSAAPRVQSPDAYCFGDRPACVETGESETRELQPLELFTDDSLLLEPGAIYHLDVQVTPADDLLLEEPSTEAKVESSKYFLIEQPPRRRRRGEARRERPRRDTEHPPRGFDGMLLAI